MNRHRSLKLSTTVLAAVFALCLHSVSLAGPRVKLGIDVLRDGGFAPLAGKRVGLVANPASVDSGMTPTVRVLLTAKDIKLAALFGPEHGVWGDEYAGDKIEDRTDPTTGLPVFSLYGKNRKPTKEMLDTIDVLVFDLQDIGSRSYTFISTLRACMEACSEQNKPFIVLDRPNPLGGVRIEGGGVDAKHESFVSYFDIPYLHGMTIGELAQMTRDRYTPDYTGLTVIKMDGWTRDMVWTDTGLTWVPTSPHIPTFAAAVGYAVTGVAGELMQISNGVGYTQPFEIVGMPGIDGEKFAESLGKHITQDDGTSVRAIRFKPFYATHKGEACQGAQIHVDPKRASQLIDWNFHILKELDAPKLLAAAQTRHDMFDKVNGGPAMREALASDTDLTPILESWRQYSEAFRQLRTKWLLY